MQRGHDAQFIGIGPDKPTVRAAVDLNFVTGQIAVILHLRTALRTGYWTFLIRDRDNDVVQAAVLLQIFRQSFQ